MSFISICVTFFACWCRVKMTNRDMKSCGSAKKCTIRNWICGVRFYLFIWNENFLSSSWNEYGFKVIKLQGYPHPMNRTINCLKNLCSVYAEFTLLSIIKILFFSAVFTFQKPKIRSISFSCFEFKNSFSLWIFAYVFLFDILFFHFDEKFIIA